MNTTNDRECRHGIVACPIAPHCDCPRADEQRNDLPLHTAFAELVEEFLPPGVKLGAILRGIGRIVWGVTVVACVVVAAVLAFQHVVITFTP